MSWLANGRLDPADQRRPCRRPPAVSAKSCRNRHARAARPRVRARAGCRARSRLSSDASPRPSSAAGSTSPLRAKMMPVPVRRCGLRPIKNTVSAPPGARRSVLFRSRPDRQRTADPGTILPKAFRGRAWQIGLALGLDRRLVAGKLAFAQRHGIDHASPSPSMVTSDLISGQLKARTSGCGKRQTRGFDDDVVRLVRRGPEARS